MQPQPKTQYVLRIEHPESQAGPYVHLKPTDAITDIVPLEYLDDRAFFLPPIAWDLCHSDALEFKYGTHVCGVEYMSHLYEWFGKNLAPLYAVGFKLYMYLLPVAKVLKGESGLQVAFNKADVLEVLEIA